MEQLVSKIQQDISDLLAGPQITEETIDTLENIVSDFALLNQSEKADILRFLIGKVHRYRQDS